MKDKKLRSALEAKTDTDGDISLGAIERLSNQLESLANALGYDVRWNGEVTKRK